MNIKITIDAPELAGAIEALAIALSGKGLPATLPTSTIEGTTPPADIKKADADVAAKEKARLAALQMAEVLEAEKAAKHKADVVAEAKAIELANQEKAKEETPETTGPTFQDVKDKLMGFSRTGRQAEMKELINSFGAAKLSDIPEDKYAEMIAKADALL